jgi:hypothetical protein
VPIRSLAFAPFLGWFKIVIDREEQGRLFHPYVRPVIAPLAHAHAKVLPEPFGTRAPQPLIVLQQMDQGRIHVFIEQTREILPPVLRGQ